MNNTPDSRQTGELRREEAELAGLLHRIVRRFRNRCGRRMCKAAIRSMCESRIYLSRLAYDKEAAALTKVVEELSEIHARLNSANDPS